MGCRQVARTANHYLLEDLPEHCKPWLSTPQTTMLANTTQGLTHSRRVMVFRRLRAQVP